ncbi:hypothetical protein DSECCO2_616180 [anaerobic digester metagenome]
MGISDGFFAVFSVNKLLNHTTADGAGTVKGHQSGDVGDAVRLKAAHNSLHTAAFQLKYAVALAARQHIIGFLIIQGNDGDIEVNATGNFDVGDGIPNHRQVSQTQQVHFQEAHFFHGFFGKLCGKAAVVAGLDRQIVINGGRGDDEARGMEPAVTGHALNLQSAGDETVDQGIVVAHTAQIGVDGEGLFDGHAKIFRHLLGHFVHVAVGHVQSPANVSDGEPRLHGTESDDLGHMVVTVPLRQILKNLAPAFDTKVGINIRHGNTGGIQKPLKEQVILKGFNVRNPQSIGDNTAGGTAPAGSYHNTVFLGKTDHIPNDQEIAGEIHFENHTEFILEAVFDFRRYLSVSFGEALFTEMAQVRRDVVAFRHGKFRQKIGRRELKTDVTLIGNFLGIGDGVGISGEKGCHFFGSLKVELTAFIFHAVFIVNGLSRLDAEEDIVVFGVFGINVMDVVGGHQGNIQFPGKGYDLGQHPLIFGIAVILDFQVIVAFTENIKVFQSDSFGFFFILRQKGLGNLTGQTSGKGDHALMVFPHQFSVDTGFIVHPFRGGERDQLAEVLVADIVFRQKNEMVALFIKGGVFVRTAAGSHIGLAADDRLDPHFFTCFIEIHRTVHHAVVRNGAGVHAAFLGLRHHAGNPRETIQQAIFAVIVQMDKLSHFSSKSAKIIIVSYHNFHFSATEALFFHFRI